jgi:hypothetical protein
MLALTSSSLAQVASVRAADDGVYGRLDGDVGLSAEAGISEALGARPHRGEALAVRGGALYVHALGLFVQYDEGLGIEALPMRRSLAGMVELRPLFWLRFANDLERGPATLDMFLDSFALDLGMYGAWPRRRFCGGDACPDFGMQLGTGLELPLLTQANTPFIAVRGAMRWSMRDRSVAAEQAPVSGLLTLTLGYRHHLQAHLADAGDRLPP